MKETVDFNQFIDRAQALGRYNQLCGYEGCRLLFDYLCDLEEDLGEEMELNITGFCCDYAVMTLDEYADEYQADALEAAKEELQKEAAEQGEDPSAVYIPESTIEEWAEIDDRVVRIGDGLVIVNRNA
jgi:hypothetical protein